ncbi:Sterol 3-beta-glucosyltransferase UGT80A2-like protein 2 [Colletotrichum chlorophyti]|uniref:Sterol 3-beta-glucosyltransferase UGT80A2-like protein 2 n=1 Tax=Colletotrichum chlorophyti TaxID=708187 RepID=A0A1Q8S8D5_9PEZI|nr:Sterol 3-beta-glucosyltransferase UGT80A2-like protein 2 [Colletotrichum chlorophyti]
MSDKRRTIHHELPGEVITAPNGYQPQDKVNEKARDGEPEYYNHGSSHNQDDGYKLLAGSMVVGDDGRVDIDCESKLARAISFMYRPPSESNLTFAVDEAIQKDKPGPPEYEEISAGKSSLHPQLNVLIQVVGSRGDVQPFVALGNELQRLGFRVRLATHDTFGEFVRDAGLEFYPVGGDPAALMAYMVKNPGLIPSFHSLRAGEIQQKRDMIEEMLEGFWYSCHRPDTITGNPFVADAIIANPPAFAHVHCAQVLGIPVHVMFTMPWTSTTKFPHPLANLSNSRDQSMANSASYAIVEYLTWQGLGDVVNRWRRSIDLEPVAMFDGPLLAERLRIPFTYCWSPALVEKPADWGAHIDVCGFFFRNAPSYSPPEDLTRFLQAGRPPVYIGFGSIVLENPERVIKTVLDAVQLAGVRAIVSKGWSNLSGAAGDDVYWIGDCPHEWLFAHVAAVVHHGGAGTTACGLRNGVPTLIVPFFGDQPFWGKMVANAGAGPEPIPFKQLTSQKLADGIGYCMTPQARSAAQAIAERMRSENGVQAAAQSWLRQLPKQRLQCDLIPSQPAAWTYKKGKKPVKISKLAAEELVSRKVIEAKHLEFYRSKPLNLDVTRWDPLTGTASAVVASTVDMTDALFGMFSKPVEEYKHEQRRRERETKRETSRQGSGSQENVGTEEGRHSLATSQIADSASFDPGQRKRRSMAATVAGASVKSFGMIVPKVAMGLVDVPLAFTEGMRVMPGHFGTKVRDHGPVTDAKSGAVVAGKTLAWGLADGLSDLVMEPVRGGIKEGVVGVVKGVGKGAISAVTKTGTGMVGLIAYPGTGIAKSIRTAVRSGTSKLIAKARHLEGQWLRESGLPPGINGDALVEHFQRLKNGGD